MFMAFSFYVLALQFLVAKQLGNAIERTNSEIKKVKDSRSNNFLSLGIHIQFSDKCTAVL